MKTVQTFSLLLSILLFGTLAHGKRKNPVQDNRPVVAVMNLKVDSENPKVQSKINELTAKIRDEVADAIDTAIVLRTKQLKQLWRKNRDAIESCYDDCDIEMAILFGAHFVISGFLEPSNDEIIATLEIIDTRSRNAIATRKVKGGNYFEIESSIMSTIKKFVRPLNSIVMQAKDDEMVSSQSSEEDEDEESPSAAQADTVTDSEGMRQKNDSEYVAPVEQVGSGLEPREEKWLEAKNEPHLADSDEWSFIKDDDPKHVGLGVVVGYPLITTQAYGLRDLFIPLIHIGAQITYNFHTLFQIALVAETDLFSTQYLKLVYSINEEEYPEVGSGDSEQYGNYTVTFDGGYDSEHAEDTRVNSFQDVSYFTLGLRPTFRLTLPIHLAELLVGVGLGPNFVKAEGTWERKRYGHMEDDDGNENNVVYQHTEYRFTQSNWGFYGVIEAGLILRFLDKKLGVGVLFQYKKAGFSSSPNDVDVIINTVETTREGNNAPEGDVSNTDEDPFRRAVANDLKRTPMRHLDSLNLAILGLTLDWKF